MTASKATNKTCPGCGDPVDDPPQSLLVHSDPPKLWHFDCRVDHVEGGEPFAVWYLTFADDDGWRGAALVPGCGMIDACSTARALGCNPGGEVVGYALAEDILRYIPPAFYGKPLTREDLDTLDAIALEESAKPRT